MTYTRELEGLGYHYSDRDGDYLLVEQWTNRPDDIKGQAIAIGQLFPRKLRCQDIFNHHNKGYPEKFRFCIRVEINTKTNTSKG